MTHLSKTTTNKAARNGLALDISSREDRIGNSYEVIEICPIQDEEWGEWVASYRINNDGSYTYDGTCYNGDLDCPGHIRSEQQLRDLLPQFAAIAV